MLERRFNIVGLRHHAWQGKGLAQRMRQAEGKRVVLMHEEMNEWNREATAAYIDTEMVGYVSNDQCGTSSAYCDQADGQLLEGRVTTVDSDHQRLTVTVAVSGELADRQDESALYELWERSYNTLPLMMPTGDEQRLLLLRRDLLLLLRSAVTMNDSLQHSLQVYEQLMARDISREATDDRQQIVALLLDSRDDALHQWGERLEVEVTALGSPEAREQLAEYVFRQLPQCDAFHMMALRYGHIDATALEAQLKLFPHHLYDEYRLSPVTFVSKLYYRRIPARPLRYFVSGLLLLEHLRGRTVPTERLAHQHQTALTDALDYVGRIAHCAAPEWQDRSNRLWQQLTADYAERITDTRRMKQATFNHRFVCRLVGTLLSMGVYRQDVPQTEYTRLLEGDSHSNLRKEINQGVDDESTRLCIRQLLKSLNG